MLRLPTSLLMLAALLLPAAGRVAVAQEAVDPVISKLDDEIATFLQSVAEKDEKRAFDRLLLGSQLHEQTSAVEQMLEKVGQFERSYGKHQESERISQKRVGKDLVLLTYLYKCKDFPVVWHFKFYRDYNRATLMNDSNNWVVIGVRFDTELDALAGQ